MSGQYKLEDLDIYKISLEIGDRAWRMTLTWSSFEKNTIGRQFVNAADSISSNIAEGYGRFFYKDRRIFCFFARGSLLETKCWAGKALKRRLITLQEHQLLLGLLNELHIKVNRFINLLSNLARNGNSKV